MPIFFTTTIHLCFWRNIQSSPFPCLHLSPRPFHKLVPLEAWIYAPVVQCHWMITIHGRHLWHPSKNSLCLWQYIGVAPRKRWPSQGFFFIISTWERSNLMVGGSFQLLPSSQQAGHWKWSLFMQQTCFLGDKRRVFLSTTVRFSSAFWAV